LALKKKMAKHWNREDISQMIRSFQPACVLTAAADLDIFTPLTKSPMTANALASKLNSDLRATTILLDALAAMELLQKQGDVYNVPEEIAELLSEASADNILSEVRHLSNCLRRWARLSEVVQTGKPANAGPSIRGQALDCAAFIGAMHNISGPMASQLIQKLQPLKFSRLLDIGGASGTWTIAFLRAVPGASATLFDLPPVIPLAQKRLNDAGFQDKVTLVGGDFYNDALPAGADLVWLSAICHQNSRKQNRALFAKIYKALQDGGTLVIRDVVMDPSHTAPVHGALFAVNMLTGTEDGGTYSFEEYRQDLSGSGFEEVVLVYRDEMMSSLIKAGKIRK
jgi:precorrin-6B methylase 2